MAFATRDLRPTQRMLLDMGRTPADLVGAELEDAREALMEAIKLADKLGERDLHVRIGKLVLELDDLRAFVAERGTG